jgi:hypothetical protein
VQFTYGGTLESPAAIESIGLPALHDARKWTVYPARAKNDRRVSGTTGVPTLGDYFRIQRGIATGANKFFILERDTARRLKLPEKFLRPILPSPRVLRTTEIERDTDGYPIIEPQLCLVDCDLPEACVKQRHPALWAYLQTASVQGLTDRYLCGKRNPWYQQEVREPSPFLITYMGRDAQRPFRFIWNRSQAIATNLFLMLYPKGAMSRLLNRSPENAARIHDLLNQISSDELRGEGRVYGGGLNKIEPRELARVSAARFLQTFAVLADSPTGQHLLFAEM